MDSRENESFRYTYSAKQQAEIRAIRDRYAPPEETVDKMAQLRRLDAGVTQKATVFALIFGIVGALILGFGMSLTMTELGEVLSLSRQLTLVVGIAVGFVGMLLVCLAYPVYRWVLTRERARVAPEILRLSDELMK